MADYKLIELHERDAYHPDHPLAVKAVELEIPQPSIGEIFFFTDEPVETDDGFISVRTKRQRDGRNFVFGRARFEAAS